MNDAEMNAVYPTAEPVAGEPSPQDKAAAAVAAYFVKHTPTEPAAEPTTEQRVREQIAEQRTAESTAEAPAAQSQQPYTLQQPEHIPADLVTEENSKILAGFSDAVSSAGVPQVAAELMLDAYVDVQTVLQYGSSEFSTGDEFTSADAERSMRRIWGTDYDKKLSAVRAVSKSLGAKFNDWLDSTGMGNSPSTILALSMVPDTKLTKAQALAELQKIHADKNYLAGKADKFTAIRAKLLGRIAYSD